MHHNNFSRHSTHKQKTPSTQNGIHYNGIFIKNLPIDIMQEDLQFLFSIIGQIKSVRIHSKKEPGKSQTHVCGFIEYKSSTDAQRAIRKFNKRSLGGRTLHVQYLQSNKKNELNLRKTENSVKYDKQKRQSSDEHCNSFKYPKKFVKIDQEHQTRIRQTYTQHRDHSDNNKGHSNYGDKQVKQQREDNYKFSTIRTGGQQMKKYFTKQFNRDQKYNYSKKSYDNQQTIYHQEDFEY